jgi:hypothetical protein
MLVDLGEQCPYHGTGRVPWSGGNEGVVVMLSDMLELVARS